ncbi:MAG: glycosyltransferase family 2 protein [Nitrospinota bacterium]|nr:glycosyltransferase family 2 protein [Nitrospinota bacterium]
MISVAIIVKDGEPYIGECLKSLESFDEVLLMDTGSTDRTMEIARGFQNVRVEEREFAGFGPTKNLAAGLAKHDWILSIDSDEVVTPELFREIQSLALDATQVYRFSRHSYYRGKFIKGCGWYPDKILRLYNKQRTGFNDNQVHESVMVKEGMGITDLKGALKHYPYDSAGSLVAKLQFYSTLFAEQNAGKRASSPMKAVSHGVGAFLKGYVIRKGFLDGYEGFHIALCQGLAAYLKYLKLYEANRKTPTR